jgi:Cu2+-exporting ATPase
MKREVVFDVEGAHCAACVTRIDKALANTPGVAEATFNLATHRVRVVHDPDAAPNEALAAAVARAGYRARFGRPAGEAARERRTALWRVGIAGLAMMQIMMFAYPAYIAEEGTLEWDVERLFAYASLLLTLPVVLFSAVPIWQGAWRGLVTGHLGMDVPVALGIFAAFAASLPATFLGGDVYYESVTMFVFFLMAGRYFEARSLAATVDATEALAELLPRRAVRLKGERREEVDPAALLAGDLVWIASGEAAPADCTLAEGATDFNEALITGESAPAAKRAGDAILAGSVNLASPVTARVERTGEQQTLALVRRLVERASAQKPRWALIADRVAKHFTLAVLVLAALAAAYWTLTEPARALPVAIAVLVVSCPCALSLATPVALTAAANALARNGVLVTSARAIEALASVSHVVFDKTGTLTTGRMRLTAVETLGALGRERCLAIAGALEQAMPHPVAHALVAASPAAAGKVLEMRAVPGSGVEANIDGARYRVGSAPFCAELAGSAPPYPVDGDSPMAALAGEGAWLAVFRFDDTVRPEAAELVRRLGSLGVGASVVSGDRAAVVERVAESVRIEARSAQASPEGKIGELERLQRSGETVAMVGDGVNDAPGLARADVSIALGGGAAAARSQADFVVLNPSLLALARAIEVARLARRVIKQNLGWSAAYNALTLPLALAGVLTPWMASLGMSLSSALVVANALRLTRLGAAPAPAGGPNDQPRLDLRQPEAPSS